MTSPVTNMPVNVTTNQNTRPVSVRTAQENEIDQIRNTPNAKKLYDAKIIGGAVGGAIPLGAAAWTFVSARSNWKDAHKVKSVLKGAVGAACLLITPKMVSIGKNLAKNLTIFFSTRGSSPVDN